MDSGISLTTVELFLVDTIRSIKTFFFKLKLVFQFILEKSILSENLIYHTKKSLNYLIN